MDFREKILREGTLKHRQTGALARWKNRHVVFKISGGGRLQFIIHKDYPPSPANEVKEIAIEEFGGLESTTKVDSEKHVFSVITTNVTDCFSTESAEEMAEWTTLLQEYLGKELTFGIVIAQKQGQLKSGRGVLRIRNTGFTITTSDSPPRCMGTWQITHIRKFGGSSSFKFQTGSKCPTGEMLYTLQTDDNDRVKSLFNDLSQHKPIFTDDRVGRRMTLERNHHTHNTPYRQSPSRFSLQSTGGAGGRDREGSDSAPTPLSPTYENKEAICEAALKLGKPLPLPPGNRRNSANDDRTPSLAGHAQRSGAPPGNTNYPPPLSLTLAKVDEQRLYQNIPGRCCSGPHSPTKPLRSGVAAGGGARYPIPPSEPVPDGYYNVSPPLALKKYPSTHSSSPEDDTFFSEFAPVPPPPIKTVSSTTSEGTYSEAYFRLPLQQTMMKIEGENLVVHRTPHNGHMGGPVQGAEGEGGREEAAMYQNLDFMSKRGGGADGITTANVYMEDTDSGPVHSRIHSGSGGQPLPIIPALDSASEVVHNYTNVEFALEAAQGRILPGGGGGGRMGASPKPLARAGDVRRKVSAPPLSRDRSGAMSYRDSSSSDAMATPVTTTTTTTSAVTSNLALSLHPKLKPSLSSQDLKEAASGGGGGKLDVNRSDLLPEYYNLFVPRLPAHQGRGEGESREERRRRIHATLSSFQSLAGSMGNGWSSGGGGVANRQGTTQQLSEETPESTKSSPTAKTSDKEKHDDDEDRVMVNPGGYAQIESGRTVAVSSAAAPRYDHLELVRTSSGSQSTRFSPVPSPSPENLSRSNTPRPQPLYDQLLTAKEMTPPTTAGERREESVSWANNGGGGKVSIPYERKIGVLGHAHTYEYIEVMLRGGGGGSRVPGPDTASSSSRHNSDPGRCESGTPVPDALTPVNEHPSQWTAPSPLAPRDNNKAPSPLPRSPATQSRRKPLPLQSVPLDESFNNVPPSSSRAASSTDKKPFPKARKLTNNTEQDSEQDIQYSSGRERSRSPTVPRPPVKHIHQRSSGGDEGENMFHGSLGENPSPRVPTRAVSVTHSSHPQFDDSTPAVPPRRDQSGFTVSLPVTEIQFDKPLVPPKPRVLEHKQSQYSTGGIQYAAMRFSHPEDESNYTQVYPNQRVASDTSTAEGGGGGGGKGVTDTTKVVYQSIDFGVTEGLRKTKEDRDIQRNREIEWLQREQNLLKTTLACTAK